MVAAVVVAVVLAVVLPRMGGDGGGGTSPAGSTLQLQKPAAAGPDPFTPSTGNGDGDAAKAATPSPQQQNRPTVYRGSWRGLYGGARKGSSCNVERQIEYLTSAPAKNTAFAGALGIEPSAVPDYLRTLTPVLLIKDTWVTNHGYKDGKARPYQAVLQAGTAVMVDRKGVPRVRCACGNPLKEAVRQSGLRPVGDPWPGYSLANTAVVAPAPTPVKVFVIVNVDEGGYLARPPGATGPRRDRETAPPGATSPPPSDPAPPPASPPTDTTTDTPGPSTPSDPGTTTTTEEPPGDDTTTEDPPTDETSTPGSPPVEPPPPPPPPADSPPPVS
ncbi:DUF6777 domain-containing protein [Streptomyces sp. NPDC006368]|uniref:DUF6777 domain-containing protein n=1 Tax=Streptomyces sp. NPDC006368 TaxID=3156760 RepID=UPI0033AC8146